MDLIKSLLKSKRAQTVLVSIIVATLGKKMGLDEAQVTQIVGALIALAVAFGLGDVGKEAAKIKAAASDLPTVTTDA